jgi:GalNAc-alpha-(1->4)-GalNAc-alpha-(1->3)-diNAcBac-PP-undecaprenol alpha-1,4-N-acetyl-D-galactosaminyltransferase
LYPKATGIICQTEYSRNFLISETRHPNIRIIPNPVKPLHQNHIARENIILNVGRLIRTKQIDVLIDCFQRLKITWLLWLVVDGLKENPARQVID